MNRRPTAADQEPATRVRPGVSWQVAMLGLASGTILIPLNSTMLAIALPRIMSEFQISPSTVSWLVTLYLITVALVMPTSGTLGDRFGHRKVFVLGVSAFAITSLVATVAWSFPMLVVARVLQAASGASMTPNAASILRAIAPRDRRGTSFGLLDMLISTSAAIGPLVGGLLISGFGWRSMFAIAIPLALTAAITVRGVVPESPLPETRMKLDLGGLALLSTFLLALLVALSSGWGSGWAGVGVLLAGLLLLVFVVRELRIPAPAINVRLFRVAPFATAVAGVFGTTIVLHATLIMVPLLTQKLMHTSAMASGVVLLGLSGLGAVTAPLGGRLSDRIGRRIPAVVGSAIVAMGLGALWLGSGKASIGLIGAMLGIIGVGFGLSGSARQTSALESVPLTSTGMAAGMYYTGRYIGGAVGAAMAGVILGTAINAAVVGTMFGILTIVAAAVTVVSLGLRGQTEGMRLEVAPAPTQPG